MRFLWAGGVGGETPFEFEVALLMWKEVLVGGVEETVATSLSTLSDAPVNELACRSIGGRGGMSMVAAARVLCRDRCFRRALPMDDTV